MKNKVVIIGCGNVGMSYAYALLNQKTYVNEVVLIDLDYDKTVGEAMDLNHGLAFAPSHMFTKAGTYEDCADAKIVVIAAGANQNVGETRMDLIHKNDKIFKSIIKEVEKSGFKGVYIIATNPVDVMTYLTWRYSNALPNRVMGSGTTLDTARLRYEIASRININPKNVHAYVVGEHGDSEFVPWTNANIGIQNIKDFLSENELDDICNKVRNAAYEIIEKKGNTSYGIGMSLVKITNAILGDKNSILTVSSYDPANNIFIGGPTIVNKDGAYQRINLKLTMDEQERMNKSVKTIKQAINECDLTD